MKPECPALIAAALLLLTAGCHALGFGAVNLPGLGDIKTDRDIAYGPREDHKLDIYLPADATAPHDVLVFLYGGRWTYGAKGDYAFVGADFARRGFVVVIPDYAKYPQVKMPVFVQDAAKAVAWTADHIAEHGGDASRIHLAGHSAGAHIGALVAADPSYLKAEGKNRAVIHDFTGLSGPYSFVPDEDDLKAMFGPPENYPLMQADRFIDGKQPPMLLLWGDGDTTVEQYNLDKMVAAVQTKGGCIDTKIYPGTGHIGTLTALTWLNHSGTPVFDDMLRYFNQHPSKGSCPGLN